MKILCPACERMAPVLAYRVEGDVLLLTCARCGTQSPVEVAGPAALEIAARPAAPAPKPPTPTPTPAPAPATAAPRIVPLRAVTDAVRLAAESARSPEPFAVPEDRCPKCVGERPPDALFCPHCGLAWANYRPEQTVVPPELAAAFVQALEHWDDAAGHDAVLALATRSGQLPELGRLYRLRLVAAPMDPIALRGRDEVLRRATAASDVLRARPAQPPQPTARWILYAAGSAVLFALALLVYQIVR